jgi:anaerobic selenocysteine-containing dehydrogenase
MNLNRRKFLKTTGAVAATAMFSGIFSAENLLFLREANASEVHAIQAGIAGYKKVYTTDTMCPSECGLEMWVRDGRLEKIYGNKANPLNGGTCCAKGAAGVQFVYAPERIKTPLIRTGERGEGKFRKASWSEAIDLIAKKLHDHKLKYGPESLVMDCGDVTDRNPYWRLAFAHGTPNCYEHGSICDVPRRHGPKLMVGGKRFEPDLMRPALIRQRDGSLKEENSYSNKLIMYVGWNPYVATRIIYENRGTVAAQVENGCKVIVVDPALSNTATKADMWLPIRPGTDGDLFGAMFRYILDNDDLHHKYIDWDFKKFSLGWDEFKSAFDVQSNKIDPINGLKYFSLDWAENRTGISKKQISEVSHMFASTKPASLVWGMQSPGHHYNGYPASILGTALNIITGNFDAPGGVIDTELAKSGKGGNAAGKFFKKRKTTRTVNGVKVTAKQAELNKDEFGYWPASWDGSLADLPMRIDEGVKIVQGPFRGYEYPIKAYICRTGNTLITASAPYHWEKAFKEKDSSGNYKLDLLVVIDTPYLETALYADVVLPEASYAERMSLSDIYPSHPVLSMRDRVIKPLHESKPPVEIMNLLAKRLSELGDNDIQAKDFWEKYKTEEDFVNEMLAVSPGRANSGTPLPYPKYPEGYKVVGTPDSLEAGRVTIDHDKKVIKGEPVTVDWMRKNKAVAVWPMSYYRYRKYDKATGEYVPSGKFLKTSSKLFEFHFARYDKYNKLIDESGVVPAGLKEIGMTRYPPTFFWFETKWNPYTNVKYKKYANEFPLQLISGRIHQTMTATQMVPLLGQTPAQGLWSPMNKEFRYDILEGDNKVKHMKVRSHLFKKDTWCVGTISINTIDAEKVGIKKGDMISVSNPLNKSISGMAYVNECIRPGVIQIAYGGGGRFSPGLGATYKQKDYTPNVNTLVDPNSMTPIMGFPTVADMMVKISKI